MLKLEDIKKNTPKSVVSKPARSFALSKWKRLVMQRSLSITKIVKVRLASRFFFALMKHV